MPQCKLCRKQVDPTTAYKIVTVSKTSGKKINTYYCSKEEYDTEEERKRKFLEDKNKVYYFICDMFGYEIQNTNFFKEWSLWNKLKTNEIIYKYLQENESLLRQICNKPYETEFNRIKYFSSILKNNLMDFKPRVEVATKPSAEISFEFFEPTVEKQPTLVEQVLYDVEDNLI